METSNSIPRCPFWPIVRVRDSSIDVLDTHEESTKDALNPHTAVYYVLLLFRCGTPELKPSPYAPRECRQHTNKYAPGVTRRRSERRRPVGAFVRARLLLSAADPCRPIDSLRCEWLRPYCSTGSPGEALQRGRRGRLALARQHERCGVCGAQGAAAKESNAAGYGVRHHQQPHNFEGLWEGRYKGGLQNAGYERGDCGERGEQHTWTRFCHVRASSLSVDNCNHNSVHMMSVVRSAPLVLNNTSASSV